MPHSALEPRARSGSLGRSDETEKLTERRHDSMTSPCHTGVVTQVEGAFNGNVRVEETHARSGDALATRRPPAPTYSCHTHALHAPQLQLQHDASGFPTRLVVSKE